MFAAQGRADARITVAIPAVAAQVVAESQHPVDLVGGVAHDQQDVDDGLGHQARHGGGPDMLDAQSQITE